MNEECETCIKRKTVYCPNSIECMATDDKPYYQNRIMLLEENQELKKHLELPEHCNLKTIEDYKSYYEDATKEEILKDTYIDYCAYVNLAHRYAELKKQLETINKKYNFESKYREKNYKMLREKDAQQKEFIDYLENEIENQKSEIFENSLTSEDINLYIMRVKLLKCEEILSKYKEIIGSDINVGSIGGKE